jgi:hypothetical protein
MIGCYDHGLWSMCVWTSAPEAAASVKDSLECSPPEVRQQKCFAEMHQAYVRCELCVVS